MPKTVPVKPTIGLTTPITERYWMLALISFNSFAVVSPVAFSTASLPRPNLSIPDWTIRAK